MNYLEVIDIPIKNSEFTMYKELGGQDQSPRSRRIENKSLRNYLSDISILACAWPEHTQSNADLSYQHSFLRQKSKEYTGLNLYLQKT